MSILTILQVNNLQKPYDQKDTIICRRLLTVTTTAKQFFLYIFQDQVYNFLTKILHFFLYYYNVIFINIINYKFIFFEKLLLTTIHRWNIIMLAICHFCS